ncbi:hypothetical protein K7X08_000394 [Anisodus acutangulus]|uniref:Uncharacterized protein n=1 Tax=Anisodus acutangulus TaxID=402998 RepID=A0A9Q1M5T0_9SOLA|nr:hypothetical protein K7X08_000394 [Anisodus acutangulus]
MSNDNMFHEDVLRPNENYDFGDQVLLPCAPITPQDYDCSANTLPEQPLDFRSSENISADFRSRLDSFVDELLDVSNLKNEEQSDYDNYNQQINMLNFQTNAAVHSDGVINKEDESKPKEPCINVPGLENHGTGVSMEDLYNLNSDLISQAI